MSTDQRTGAVSAPWANSQRFQRILKFFSVKISAEISKKCRRCSLYSEQRRHFRTEKPVLTVQVYSETNQRHQRADLALKK